MMAKISDLFEVRSGDFHALKELELGNIPLVSCGDTDNGVMGYYDVPAEKQYNNTITVAYNGSWPIMSKFHPYTFGAKDDVAVLLPIHAMSKLALLYTAALFNRMTWRYSYGRKCFREKLEEVQLPIPIANKGNFVVVDEVRIAQSLPQGIQVVAAEIAKSASVWTEKANAEA
jgi:type I restriction enzyme M protein